MERLFGFGLVSVPVKLYTATENHDVRFHQVHEKDGGRVRMKRVCEVCGEEVSFAEIGKGYTDATGRTVIIEPDDFESLPIAETSRNMEVVEFVPNEQIDPILYEKAYYLEPDDRNLKPYVLLRDALQETDRTAIVQLALRQKTQLACLQIRDGVLVLQTLRWPDEVRPAMFAFVDEDVQVRPQELKMAESLIETMAADFDPEQYKDEYQEALLALIEAKLAGVEPPSEPVATGTTAPVVDLMAALRESVERSKAESVERQKAQPEQEDTEKRRA